MSKLRIPENTTLTASLFGGMRQQGALEDYTDEQLAEYLKRYGCKLWIFNGQSICTFPALNEMRANFCRVHGQQEWTEKASWNNMPDPPTPGPYGLV